VLDEDPAYPPQRGTGPNFQPMSVVAKRSPISVTAEHLYFGSVLLYKFRCQIVETLSLADFLGNILCNQHEDFYHAAKLYF